MTEFSQYQGKRVVVSGCPSGIGAATARALVDLGADVVGVGLDAPDLALGSFETLDLAEPTSIEGAVERIGGKVDALFNCAGATPMTEPLTLLKVNFLGTRLLTERVTDLMGTGGTVVSVSSDGGFAWRRSRGLILDFLAAPGFDGGLAWYEEHQAEVGHSYAFGKQALDVWTMVRSAGLIQRGIRINVTSPGAVQTPMLDAIEAAYTTAAIAATEKPIGRRSSPEEQVGPLLFLNSSAASYINGVDLQVDGGYWASLSLKGELD